jgi:S-adenosylmethionine-diacylglycerol 3-amino-3-carboxypropyl transferase
VILDIVRRGIFRLCHGSQLVYNTCWEDPRLDRQALRIGPSDQVLVITSAGCNVLDYLLDEPDRVYAVDVNPRQNALLELKLAGVRALDYDTFFQLFGRGYLATWKSVYKSTLRSWLSEEACAYWDVRGKMFESRRRRGSFYFRGSTGLFAWWMNVYIDRVAKLRPAVDALFDATSLEEQREIYKSSIKPVLWNRAVRWITRRDVALAMLGVPRSQRRQIDTQFPGGISAYVESMVDELMMHVPVHDNYFWRVYVSGQYTPECCPEYLKCENFQRLKDGLVDRVEIHTKSVVEFLRSHGGEISRFVLLDHMDWLYDQGRDLLAQEWQSIVDRAAPRARVIWRSAALAVDFVDPLAISLDGAPTKVGEVLRYEHDLAAQLHRIDRVHTYGSFYVGELSKGIDTVERTESVVVKREQADAGRLENALSPECVSHSRG